MPHLVPIFVVNIDDNNGQPSQDDLIATNNRVAQIYYVDVKDVDKVTGDDWNDAPAFCNADRPYLDRVPVYYQEIRLGLPVKEPVLITEDDD